MSIPSSPRRSRIAHFKAPFILSVAGSAALGLGCGGKTDADLTPSLAQDDADDARALPCKGKPPSATNSCGGLSANCINGEWLLSYNACNPPPPPSEICPADPR